MVYGREVALQFFMPPRVCQSIIGVRFVIPNVYWVVYLLSKTL